MSITVKFFASIRERLGKSEEKIDFSEAVTVAGVWERVVGGSLPPNTLVAVNQEYATPEHSIHDGDEVAFFPPVTGG